MMTMQIFEDVHCLDFSSLYPNIIRQCNLSPEFEYSVNYSDDPDINLVIDMGELKSEHAILPDIVTELIELRKDYRSKGMEAEQLACKIAVNSVYGVLSQRTAKYILGGTHLASTVTWVGRTILKNLVKRLPKKSITVIYGKTDSIFVISDKYKTKEEILKITQETANEIVKDLTGFENKFILFDYEEFIKKMILLNRNNYAKIYIDGSRKYKGASFSNSTSSKYELELMEYLVGIIDTDKNYKEDLSEKANEFLKEKLMSEDIYYFSIKHKPREEKVNKFDQVDFMLENNINIEYGFSHNAVICNYDGNKEGVLVYPLNYKLDKKYRPNRRWLKKINKQIIDKLDLPERQKQYNLDTWFNVST